ncbi:MAG: matrixin family metalloprotease, partial [Cyanobacteria bacterium J06631_9]
AISRGAILSGLLFRDRYWPRAGIAIVLTYSLDTTGPNGLDSSEVAMVREAFRQWSKVANITFRQSNDRDSDLRIAGEPGTGGGAQTFAIRPGSRAIAYVEITIGKGNPSGKGGRFLATAIHEIGHALGLKHPGNYNGRNGSGVGPFVPDSADNNTNSVMSYNEVGTQVTSPMAYDIAAVQSLYGARRTTSGDSFYQFRNAHSYNSEGSPFIRSKQTLWDSGGRDVVSFANAPYKRGGYLLSG